MPKTTLRMPRPNVCTREFIEDLVEAVRKRVFLYNQQHKSYSDLQKCRNAWAEIGEEMVSGANGRIQVIRSSLPYQILLYLNAWYFVLFFIAELFIFIYKGETLPFATSVLPAEVILVFILAGIEALRLFFGQKGNLTERIAGIVVCIILSIPSLFGALYLILWQTYVLRIDVILAAIQLVFIGLELVFGIVSVITFARATPY